MKTYKIFKNPIGKYEAVKQGWSWPGFFFGIIWACVKKMWALGLGLFTVFFILAIIGHIVYGQTPELDAAFNVLSCAVSIWFGMKGNQMREENLVKRGYIQAPEIIHAGNPEAAVAQYISEYEN